MSKILTTLYEHYYYESPATPEYTQAAKRLNPYYDKVEEALGRGFSEELSETLGRFSCYEGEQAYRAGARMAAELLLELLRL